jgi:hypothetical protein
LHKVEILPKCHTNSTWGGWIYSANPLKEEIVKLEQATRGTNIPLACISELTPMFANKQGTPNISFVTTVTNGLMIVGLKYNKLNGFNETES